MGSVAQQVIIQTNAKGLKVEIPDPLLRGQGAIDRALGILKQCAAIQLGPFGQNRPSPSLLKG